MLVPDRNYMLIMSSFLSDNAGEYALEITVNDCKDTSFCETLVLTSIKEKELIEFNVIPNISSESIYLSWSENCTLSNVVSITIMDQNGSELYKVKLKENKVKVNVSNLSTGTYIVKLVSECSSITSKFIKID